MVEFRAPPDATTEDVDLEEMDAPAFAGEGLVDGGVSLATDGSGHWIGPGRRTAALAVQSLRSEGVKMTESRPVFGPDTKISDIDLDQEVFMLPDGRRLTDDLAESIAEDAI